MQYQRSCSRAKGRGFTLVEIMVVIVILGLLAGLVANNVVNRITKAKITAARADIKTLENAVLNYKMDTGQYPNSLQDLVEQPPDVMGWDKDGYLMNQTQVPLDPWGSEYNYQYPGEFSPKFDIWSWGADGQEGGDDEDADIYNVVGDLTSETGSPDTRR